MVGRIPSYAGEDPSDPNSGYLSPEVHKRLVHVVRKIVLADEYIRRSITFTHNKRFLLTWTVSTTFWIMDYKTQLVVYPQYSLSWMIWIIRKNRSTGFVVFGKF